ncbi:MAG TPA: hypothetical protein VL916_12180, partial [Ilumatobacteraceae bacterium]|nr:hypothetical protein [Ilumatobacteraceae bacterium]
SAPVLVLVASRTVVASPRRVGATAVAVDGAMLRPVVDRATAALSAVSLPAQHGGARLAPMSVWWLMLGLAVALATQRRCRLLRAPRR